MAAATDSAPRWRVPVLCLALAAMTFAVFGQTLSYQFVDFDDNAYVYENPVVAKGLTRAGLAWAFDGAHAHNWHPLTWLSHMLDCQLYGPNPAGHHLTSVLLHMATVITLFLVLRGMTGAVWRSAVAAALFAVHPLRVESVAWVAERKDVLSGLFFVLTIAAYFRFARQPRSFLRYGLVALLFALGLMSKPMVVTLPLVLLVLDFWPLRREESAGRLVLEKLPLFALSAASCVVTLLAQHAAIRTEAAYPLPLRLANAVVSIMVYLAQTFYPAGLAAIYPYPHQGLPPLEIALAVVLLLGVSALAWWQRQKQPWFLAGWLWYLIVLLPVLGIVQVGNQAHADRYTYLPQIGLAVAVTWLAAQWVANRTVLTTLAVAALAILMIDAAGQAAFWKDSQTMWTHALACTSNNDMAHYGMGDVYLAKSDWTNAAAEFRQAAKIRPDYVEAHNNLGLALFHAGQMDEALAQFKTALQLQPEYGDARFNLGNYYLEKKLWDQAISSYQSALQLQPDHAVIHGNLGIALFQLGKTNEATAEFKIAADLAPEDPGTHFNLARVFRAAGQLGEAIPEYEKVLALDPNYDAAANSLAWLLATTPAASLRNGPRALQLAQRLNTRANGKNPIYLRTLAAACAETGDFAGARESTLQAEAIVRAAGRNDMDHDLEGDLQRYADKLPLRL